MRTLLSDMVRKLNIEGDKEYQRWFKSKADEAELDVSRLTDKAVKAVEGDYKGKDLLKGLQFVSNFIPKFGKFIDMGLSFVDAQKTKEYNEAMTKEFKKNKIDPKNPFAKYLKGNFDALVSQVDQKNLADTQQVMKENIMDSLIQSGLASKIPEGIAASMIEQGGIGADIISKTEMDKNIFSKFFETGPSVYDIGKWVSPMIDKKLTTKEEPTYPGIGPYSIKSLRRTL